MITCFTKKNTSLFLGKWLFIILVIYTVYLLPILNSSYYLNLTFWEFILLAVTGMYYVLYVLVLSYICFIFRSMPKEEPEILVRSKTFLKIFPISSSFFNCNINNIYFISFVNRINLRV